MKWRYVRLHAEATYGNPWAASIVDGVEDVALAHAEDIGLDFASFVDLNWGIERVSVGEISTAQFQVIVDRAMAESIVHVSFIAPITRAVLESSGDDLRRPNVIRVEFLLIAVSAKLIALTALMAPGTHTHGIALLHRFGGRSPLGRFQIASTQSSPVVISMVVSERVNMALAASFAA
jgi:hypothetical protein